MRVLLQRVTHAGCTIDHQCSGQIEKGYLALVGITHEDNIDIIEKMASKSSICGYSAMRMIR